MVDTINNNFHHFLETKIVYSVTKIDFYKNFVETQVKAKNIVKYVASFQFDARNADELSFGEGDVVDVDLNAPAEPEWFYGTCQGRSGLFPQAYVQLMEDQATSPFVPVQQPVQSMPPPTTVIEGTVSFVLHSLRF